MKRMLIILLIAFFVAGSWAADDIVRANSYDDAWETGWVNYCRTIYATAGKTPGFTLQVGDSISHSNPNSQWARYGSGKTTEDTNACTFIDSTSWGTGNFDTSSKNGWYLAAADTSGQRGMTASSGISAGEYVSGAGNGGTTMPSTTNNATALGYVADGTTYSGNLQIDTVCAAFGDAQFAVLMLGTNDASGSVATATFLADLGTIIDTLEGQNIVVILSTIPPHINATNLVKDEYNPGIRTLAQTRNLPLIDYYEEILLRQPGTAWNGTLLGLNDVHPSATGSSSDPYATGGSGATHTTGTNCDVGGYLLRSWLTIQKIKEVKLYVVDGVNPSTNLTISTSSLPDGAEGAAYNQVLAAANITGTDVWSIASGTLPTGLSLSAAGVLSGTPGVGTAGTYNFTVQVDDDVPSSDTQALSLDISGPGSINATITGADDVGIRDTWIISTDPTNDGGRTTDFVRMEANAGDEDHALVQIDLSAYGAAESCDLAILRLYETSSNHPQLTAYPLTTAWNLSQTCWNLAGAGAWAGGTFSTSDYDSGTPITGTLNAGWWEFDITTQVNAWIAGSLTNNGLVIMCDVPSQNWGNTNLASSNTATTAQRPQLVMTSSGGGGSTYSITGTISGLLPGLFGIQVDYSGDKSGFVNSTTSGIYAIGSIDDGDTITVTPDDASTGYTIVADTTDTATIASANATLNYTATVNDSDGNDGLPDPWEYHYFGDPATYDGTDNPDGDSLDNAAEYLAGRNPAVSDDVPATQKGSSGGCMPAAGAFPGLLMALALTGLAIRFRK